LRLREAIESPSEGRRSGGADAHNKSRADSSELDVFRFELSHDETEAISYVVSSGNRIVSPTGLSPAWDPTPTLAT
jgi:hypothetical protein